MNINSPRYIDLPGMKIHFRRPAWPLTAIVVTALVVIISLLDYRIGPEQEFSIFYLIPVTVAVFLSGGAMGAAASIASAAAWLAADYFSGAKISGWFAFLWDDAVQLGFFLMHTLVISWLLRTIREVRVLSLHDPLTAAANWRYFEEQAATRIRIARRNRAPVTIAYIDLDNFKKVNDDLGHQAGNEVLKTVAAAIQSQIRPNDLLARLGGDEFGLLIDDTGSDEIRAVLDRVVAETGRRLGERKLPVTLSVGAITYREPPDSLDPIMKEADRLMYRAKQSGKNMILYSERP
jgi:diguanylate cyclase (GGDEF)-like protein